MSTVKYPRIENFAHPSNERGGPLTQCNHDRVRRGPGSAYHEIECVDCHVRVGQSLSIESQKRAIDSLTLQLKFAKQDLIEAERWAAWVQAHPGVEPEEGRQIQGTRAEKKKAGA